MNKSRAVLLVLILGTPLMALLCLTLGSSGIGFPDLGTPIGKAIFSLRANRVAGGFIVGAALSCAGVVFQALLRNPLAEPYILGVSSGAGLGAAIAILTGLSAAGLAWLPGLAFIGAIITLTLVFTIAHDGGSPSVYSLILSGVIVSSVCSSILMFMVAIAPVEGLHSVVWWMLGDLQPAGLPMLLTCGSFMLAGALALWSLSPELNAMTLGTETAHHLGIRTGLVMGIGLILATMITAASVGLAGLIGFVGLIIPHVIRALVGPDHRRLIPAAALGGGTFLMLCDALARILMAPREIPVGVITAIFGGPFFLLILRAKRRRGWMA